MDDNIKIEYLGTINEEDGKLSIIVKNLDTGRIYKFTHCIFLFGFVTPEDMIELSSEEELKLSPPVPFGIESILRFDDFEMTRMKKQLVYWLKEFSKPGE